MERPDVFFLNDFSTRILEQLLYCVVARSLGHDDVNLKTLFAQPGNQTGKADWSATHANRVVDEQNFSTHFNT